MADVDKILRAIQGGGTTLADEEDDDSSAPNAPTKSGPINTILKTIQSSPKPSVGPPPTFQNLYAQPQVPSTPPTQQAANITAPGINLAPPQNPPLQAVDATQVPLNFFTNRYMSPTAPVPPPAPAAPEST